jgi:NAD(P)-dependent dehydrogenase (short-subunit alcohol dehydrogenase family)
MPGRLEGKVALITGAASGIGLATAERFCREGAAVVLADLQAEAAGREAARLRTAGGRAEAAAVDVTRSDDVRRAVRIAVDRFGRLDVLFANAGIAYSGALVETSDEDWDRVMAVNAKGVFLCAREAVRQMLAQDPPGGSLILNASISGLAGIAQQAPYAPSKGAVVQLTRQLAVEYAARGVRVNCVCPGTVDTPLLRHGMAMSGDPEGFLAMLMAGHPVGRIGRAEEIAAAVLFLASDDASFVHGAILPVDGGYTAR